MLPNGLASTVIHRASLGDDQVRAPATIAM